MNSKTGRAIALLAVTAALTTTTVFADNAFEFKGYTRAGVLYNSSLKYVDGVDKEHVGRLGNESDLYVEAELIKSVKAGQTWSKYHLLMAGGTTNFPTWDDAASGLHIRNAFVEIGGAEFAPSATFWVGKRFYGRDDIHITDVYWRDMSGTGAGVQGLVDGALDIAIINGNSIGNYEGRNTNANIDVRYRTEMGLEFEGVLGLRGDASKINAGSEDMNFQLGVIYSMSNFFGIGAGFSRTALQFGVNTQSWALGKCEWNDGAPDGDNSLRFVSYGVTEMGDWQIMPEVVFEMDMPDDSNLDNTWNASLGVRPVLVINNNFALAFEGAVGLYKENDDKTGKNKDTTTRYKFTVAPTLKVDTTGFWNRPELRAFVSFVGQDKDLGKLSADGKDETEVRFGFQAETWF
jgi:maltoporin